MTLMNEPELFEPRTQRFSFTVDQYHEMLASGIIEEGAPYELLNGQIIRKDRSASGDGPMTIGLGHAWAVTALERLGPKWVPRGCFRFTRTRGSRRT
jgi:hypothetical protein